MQTSTRRFLSGLPVAAAMAGVGLLAGCGDSAPATSQAGVDVVLSSGASGGTCPTSSEEWSTRDGAEIPVIKDGDTTKAGIPVNVVCKVAGDDTNGYDVKASAVLRGKGTVTIEGKLTTATTPQPVKMTFASATALGTFSQSDCTSTFVGGISAGRVWVNVDCSGAKDTSKSPNPVCRATAELRFENCVQN